VTAQAAALKAVLTARVTVQELQMRAEAAGVAAVAAHWQAHPVVVRASQICIENASFLQPIFNSASRVLAVSHQAQEGQEWVPLLALC
jgi:hypothetical protein